MAKKFENPLEQMKSMPAPESKPTSRRRKRVGDFANPLDAVSAQDKARAVGSSLVAGRYLRRTFTFTPGQLRRIKELARELHVAETGVARWLIDEGLAQWEQGVRPEMREEQVKLEPVLRNW